MFRLLYVTDLHGWTGGYERIAAVAQEEEITTIVNGGDMFPHGRDLISTQRRFIEGNLGSYLGSGASIFSSPARRSRDRLDNGLLTDVPGIPR